MPSATAGKWPADETAHEPKGPAPYNPVLGALILAQSALRRWTELYSVWSAQMPVQMDRKLPPGDHVRALEAIAEAMEAVKMLPRAASPARCIPEGWKLVPVEPTQRIIERMEGVGGPADADEPSSDGISWQEWHRRRWKWILEVVPAAPEAPTTNAAPQADTEAGASAGSGSPAAAASVPNAAEENRS